MHIEKIPCFIWKGAMAVREANYGTLKNPMRIAYSNVSLIGLF